MIYKIDCLEMSCTCPASRFNPKTVCKHVKPIINRASPDGKFRVWKLPGEQRWYGATRYRGVVSDNLPELMECIG